MKFMEFIKPKNIRGRKVDWILSEQTRSIVKYYAQYTDYNENEVVDQFIKNILLDEQFVAWIDSKRNNKRIVEQIFGKEEETEA